jgi:hypothetical protein
VVDADVVVEERGDAVLEAVELRPGVLAQREDEVHAQVGLVDEPRELGREGALALLGRLVEEVLLELVEHDEQRPHPLGPDADGLEQRLARLPGRQLLAAERLRARRPQRLGERGQRVVAPAAERADRKRRPLRAAGRDLAHLLVQVVHDPGVEDGRFADAARAVEDRQPGRAQVRGDDRLLLVAAEEERGVALAVGDEADEGRRRRELLQRLRRCERVGHGRGAGLRSAVSAASSRSTYSLSGA